MVHTKDSIKDVSVLVLRTVVDWDVARNFNTRRDQVQWYKSQANAVIKQGTFLSGTFRRLRFKAATEPTYGHKH